ncbi:retrovirus-related Pol polyprotein from transposon 412 [Trichonephila clavipes]|nr:retrovirus-related Pol polyprotein from transposon 412 [Trichonephila clavipes]
MDYFTKWLEAYPIPEQEASTVAEVLVQHWFSRFGVPLQLHSNQGTNFDSAVCKRLCEILPIDKTRTTALHPQSDGMVERFNRTILNSLSILVSSDKVWLWNPKRHTHKGLSPKLQTNWERPYTVLKRLNDAVVRIQKSPNSKPKELWFQQDGATCHTARATIDLLKDTFGDRLISRFGPVNWPPRSCDLTTLDYFLWGYVKSLVYADKPQTLDHLVDNIHRVIADMRPQMLEKVIEN